MSYICLARIVMGVCLLFTTAYVHLQAEAQPGPDTTAEPTEKIGTTGNWIKKREWLMKANEVFTEIQDTAAQSEQTRKIFIDKFNETDTMLDAYYNSLGLNEGKVTELFDGIMHYLDSKRKKELAGINLAGEKPTPELQAKIDIIESNIKNNRLHIEQLKLDMKSIEDLGKSLSDRIKRVDERMQTIQAELANGQSVIDDLWDIIDHNKAREKYYTLKMTILEKIKTEQSYLQDDLMADFDSVIQTIRTQIARTEDEVKKVEAEGFIIKNRATRINEIKLKELASKKEAAAKTEQSQTLTSTAAAAASTQKTWLQRVYQGCIDLLATLWRLIMGLKDMVLGSKQAALNTTPAQKQAPQLPLQAAAGGTTLSPQIATLPTAAPTQQLVV